MLTFHYFCCSLQLRPVTRLCQRNKKKEREGDSLIYIVDVARWGMFEERFIKVNKCLQTVKEKNQLGIVK